MIMVFGSVKSVAYTCLATSKQVFAIVSFPPLTSNLTINGKAICNSEPCIAVNLPIRDTADPRFYTPAFIISCHYRVSFRNKDY